MEKTNIRKITLTFSDAEFGTEEFGYLDSFPRNDLEAEDMRYERHVKRRLPNAKKVRVVDSTLYIKE